MLADKRLLAIQYTKEYSDLCAAICIKIFSTYDVDMMGQFLDALHCIYDLLKRYNRAYVLIPMNNSVLNCTCYFPRLLHMRQEDCSNILYDIVRFSEKACTYLKYSTNMAALNVGIRFSYTFSLYFRAVKIGNPVFHNKQPAYVRKTFRHRYRRVYSPF